MIEPWTPVDPLGETLHYLRMNGVFYCRTECTAPWALMLPPMPGTLMFHVVTAGRCWLQVDGAEDALLAQGDLALVPHGEGHRLASAPGADGDRLFDLPRELVSERYEILRLDGGGAPATIICGAVRFDHPAARHLLGGLPRLIRIGAVDAPSPQMDWMGSTLRLMAAEARALTPGGEAIITRLADILVILAIRTWLDRDPAARTGWLGALRDQRVGRAIALIHRDAARAWSVDDLAAEVAMSRSAFAARFMTLVGEPPMRYVTRWRMYLAQTALEEQELTVGELALRLGYRSEAAFSRAFKRFSGVAPGAVRRGGGFVAGPPRGATGLDAATPD